MRRIIEKLTLQEKHLCTRSSGIQVVGVRTRRVTLENPCGVIRRTAFTGPRQLNTTNSSYFTHNSFLQRDGRFSAKDGTSSRALSRGRCLSRAFVVHLCQCSCLFVFGHVCLGSHRHQDLQGAAQEEGATEPRASERVCGRIHRGPHSTTSDDILWRINVKMC